MLNYSASGLTAFTWVCLVIDILAVILRFWSRAVSPGVRFALDDWLALASLVPAIGVCAVMFGLVDHGIGKHASELSQQQQIKQLQYIFAHDMVFTTSVSLSKLSAMAFFARIFGVRSHQSRLWRISYFVVLATVVVWPLAFIPYVIFSCTPVRKFWMGNAVSGRCLNQFRMLIAIAGSGAIVDIMILILPIPLLFGLQMKFWKKSLVIFTFLVGYSVAFMSIARAIVIVQIRSDLVTDFPHAIVPKLFWAVAEVGDSVLAVCLPAIFHLLKRGWTYGPRALFSTTDFTRFGASSDRRPLERSSNGRGSSLQWLHEAKAATASVDEVELQDVPSETIMVRKDVKIGIDV